MESKNEIRTKIACGRKYNDRRGENTCGQKDWGQIDLCPECQAKWFAVYTEGEVKN